MRALGFEPKKEEIQKMISDVDDSRSGFRFGVKGSTVLGLKWVWKGNLQSRNDEYVRIEITEFTFVTYVPNQL